MSTTRNNWRPADSAPERTWVLVVIQWADQSREPEATRRERMIAMRYGDEWKDRDGRSGYTVAHWQPLPEMPEDTP